MMDAEEMSDVVFEVLMPTERVAEVKKRQKVRINTEVFPWIPFSEYASPE